MKVIAAASLGLALVCASAAAQDSNAGVSPEEIKHGAALFARHCATCHAIGPTGASPYSPAPPFRRLHERYDIEALAEALAEGMIVGHGGARQMPQFVLSPAEIDDLLAYLKSLETS